MLIEMRNEVPVDPQKNPCTHLDQCLIDMAKFLNIGLIMALVTYLIGMLGCLPIFTSRYF